MEEQRREIAQSFQATTRLLNDLELAENDTSSLHKLHSNMDGLVKSLSNASFDITGDLNDIMDSFSQGRVSVSMLEDMVLTEHARSLTLTKMTGAMKLQLESVFGLMEKVAESGEAHLRKMTSANRGSSGGGGSSGSSSSPGGESRLQKQIDSLYADFSGVLSTVDSMERIVKAPAKAVSASIATATEQIDQRMQKLPADLARRLSSSKGVQKRGLRTVSSVEPTGTESATTTTENGTIGAAAAADEPDAGFDGAETSMMTDALADGASSAVSGVVTTAEGAALAAAERLQDSGSVFSHGGFRVKAFAETGTNTEGRFGVGVGADEQEQEGSDVLSKAADKKMGQALPNAEIPELAVLPVDPFDDLVIKGNRATGSLKEIARMRSVLQAKQAELTAREEKLFEQQLLLDARSSELRRVAHKVVCHESEAQRMLRDLAHVVDAKVAEKMAVLLLQPAQQQGLSDVSGIAMDENSETQGDREIARAKGEGAPSDGGGTAMADGPPVDSAPTGGAAGDDDDASFLAASVKSAQASHNGTEADLTSECTNQMDADGIVNALHPGSAGVSRPWTGDNRIDTPGMSYCPSGVNAIPSIDRGMLISRGDNEDIETLGLGSLLGPASVGGGHSVNEHQAMPPPLDAPVLPDMMVIFPAKTVEVGTMTTISGSAANSAAGGGVPENLPLESDIKTVSKLSKSAKGSKSTMPLSDMDVGLGLGLGSPSAPDSPDGQCADGLSLVSGGISGVIMSTVNNDVDLNMRPDLPTVASKDGFTTRTYRHIPPRDFKKQLSAAENPLLMLYNEYKDCMPDIFHSPLLDAASGQSSLRAMETFRELFARILPDMHKLDNSSSIVLKELVLCEDMANSIIVVAGNQDIKDALYHRSLRQLYEKFGEIEGLKLWVDVQLGQYRAIFERVNALDVRRIPSMVKASALFEEAYEVFVSCTGRAVEATARIKALENRCKRYGIGKARGSGGGGEAGAGEGTVPLVEYLRLAEDHEALKGELEEAQEEAEELNLEVFRVMHEGDRTPGALLFFATLHDPVTTSVLQQVIMQLRAVKGFAAGTEHLDFAALRKRLQVCISAIPNIERFVQRYSMLHKKWINNRLGLFTSKGQVGGGSDNANLCPMCCGDPSHFKPPGGLVNRKSQQEAKKARTRQKMEEYAAVKRQQFAEMQAYAVTGGGKKHAVPHAQAVVGGGASMTDSVGSASTTSLPSIHP